MSVCMSVCACASTSGGLSSISLEQVLSFSTGSTLPTPGGFASCVLMFSDQDPYPTASTCSMELHLPLQHKCFQGGLPGSFYTPWRIWSLLNSCSCMDPYISL